MNICLVNPTPERIIELAGTDTPHIGLGYLSSYLKKKLPRLKVTVLDGKLENLNRADLIERIIELNPDLLGMTSFTQEIYDAANISGGIKKKNKNVITCIGGVHATGVEEQVLYEFNEFDYAIYGEGEKSFSNLIQNLLHDKIPRKVNGLIYRNRQGKIIRNPPAPLVYDLDSLPSPDWSFAPRARYYPVLTSRGCPFKCVFCMRPYGNKPRTRSPEKVANEIESVRNLYSNDRFIFYDESLGAARSNFEQILDLIISRRLNISWEGHTHVNLASAGLFRKMKESGCRSIGFGIESGDNNILKKIGKSITTEKAHKAVNLAKQAGISTSTYFILGLPGESYKSALKTIQFAKSLNADTISIGIIIPFPKTKVSEMVYKGEGGYIPPMRKPKWDEFNKQNMNPVRFKNISWRFLRFIQISGYIYHSLYNFRLGSFIKRFKRQRSQVINIIISLFGRRTRVCSSLFL